MGSFRRFFRNFLQFFWNFPQFFRNFLRFFGKFSQKFSQFFSTFAVPSRFFRKFFRKFSPTIRYGSTGVSSYCKFTIKFTLILILILIKILQSTKFEGSHFFHSLPTFSTPYPLSQLLNHFLNSLRPFPLFALLSLRHRVFPTIAPPCQRYQWPSLPLRWRRYVGNTRDYK